MYNSVPIDLLINHMKRNQNIFYLLCGAAGALLQGYVDPQSNIPMVGASGAIAGVLGAYLLLFPRANVRCLVFIIIIIQIRMIIIIIITI